VTNDIYQTEEIPGMKNCTLKKKGRRETNLKFYEEKVVCTLLNGSETYVRKERKSVS
jgi:hypothetical protein